MPMPQTQSQASEGGQIFNIVQEHDVKKEEELEDKLYQTSMELYTGRTVTVYNGQVLEQEASLADLAFRTIGTLEFARTLLVKYKDIPSNDVKETIEDIEDTIHDIRYVLINSTQEDLINSYKKIEDKILFTLGPILGFRKRKSPKYTWLERTEQRTQITETPKLKEIIEKKKAKGS